LAQLKPQERFDIVAKIPPNTNPQAVTDYLAERA
jgi:hypothetical protein